MPLTNPLISQFFKTTVTFLSLVTADNSENVFNQYKKTKEINIKSQVHWPTNKNQQVLRNVSEYATFCIFVRGASILFNQF